MAFHDAGTYNASADTGGANGSILNELSQAVNAGMTLCPPVINSMLSTLSSTSGCSGITAADIIQVTGAAAVSLLGGPTCALLIGRPNVVGNTEDNVAGLPNLCDTSDTSVNRFSTMGFRDPVTAVVTLAGAHKVGQSRANLRGPCSKGLGPMTANPTSFDGHYYTEVVQQVGRRGWFSSDNNLNANGAVTASLMQNYSASHSSFLSSWCAQYQEMSLLGVDPTTVAGYSINDGWLPNVVAVVSPTPSLSPNATPSITSPSTTTSSPRTPAPSSSRPVAPSNNNPRPIRASPTPTPISSLTSTPSPNNNGGNGGGGGGGHHPAGVPGGGGPGGGGGGGPGRGGHGL
ncbi:hypothetical protein CEUSTIGMA_g9238.t1 [Chlamydomonas eustigma]|uniref:Plant heme peroxidase family profile domain-containing protein n=1 Tax=Chlamydomonas eustigma TaxID=1157962 RepID=A0A250XG95_9CHLO|nr:hypothetical protein CEUSTIGMA_g9238.t1 [Chlamydomonas eustigma]|eukprot:GAX81810.1 hypothetical protein CEUSTIGMA_g9238.t1 [Chlamydomonas eustigma]